MSAAKTETAPAAKKGGSKTLIIGAVVVLLAAGGGGAYWMMRRGTVSASTNEAPAHAEAAKADDGHNGVLSFEPFVVNLADPGGGRYLRATVRLIVDGEAEAVKKNEVAMVRTRSALLDLLAEQTSDQIVTPAGKAALKKAMLERISGMLAPAKVVDVLFSDFVVQF